MGYFTGEHMLNKKILGEIKDTGKIFIQAALITLLIRSFIIQPFVIPSGSMRPTLLVGDYIFVNKFAYGYSRYSVSTILPLPAGRIFSKLPKRGDIVVFNHKDAYDNERKDFIKRLIGLPGDRVQMREGVLYINDKAVEHIKLNDITSYDVSGTYEPVNCYKEKLDNGVCYNTLDIDPYMRGNNTIEFVVPSKHYFMMGDNRDNSEDSRFSLGYIPDDELLGRANYIFFSLKDNVPGYAIWKWFGHIRWNRLLTPVNSLRYGSDK